MLGGPRRPQMAEPAAVARPGAGAYSGPAPQELRAAAAPKTLPVRDGALRWDRLDATLAEAQDVRHFLSESAYGPVRLYLRDEALEDLFKRVSPPRLLHISTHGFFLEDSAERDANSREHLDLGHAATTGKELLRRGAGLQNPLLRSGLVLAGANMLHEQPATAAVDDGWVTAEEIAQMNLQGTELVVLSACETALGDVRTGEGVYGLRRAFQHAGARTLLSTLFAIPSDETRQMMKSFYAGVKQRRGKLAALHGAQLEIIRARRRSVGAAHPFFWAGFVLVGNPN